MAFKLIDQHSFYRAAVNLKRRISFSLCYLHFIHLMSSIMNFMICEDSRPNIQHDVVMQWDVVAPSSEHYHRHSVV